jgi:hypothetical protein
LNAGVPFEIASVPVMALQPSANARISKRSESVSAWTWIGMTSVTWGGTPSIVRATPTTTRRMTLTMKM